MFALVDCNSFFCSVEKVFHPGLDGKPVVVLSSNDGCIVALTPEAKALGLHRGDPIFKVRDTVERGHVRVFSSNIRLYAAMSQRVTGILRKSVHHVENYSIDESFCFLDGYERHYDLEEFMRQIVEKIRLWTDIPVSVGIAPTKTLAKMGSKFAKQYPGYRSVCMIDSEAKRLRALELFPVEDIWGIGRGALATLQYFGIATPREFADRPESWVRRHFKLPAVRTWLELNGHPCIDTAEVAQRQTICHSRSFGQMVGTIDGLREAVAHFAAGCAATLRGQRSVAAQVSVFVCSNRFRDDLPQYSNAATAVLPVPSADTAEITTAAIATLRQIFRPGILYKKAGVVLSGLAPADPFATRLFDPVPKRLERARLMRAIDNLNQKYGLKSLHLAAEGGQAAEWQAKSGSRTPDHLTDIAQLLTVE